MPLGSKRSGGLLLWLMVGLVLPGCARAGWAAETWSAITVPQEPGKTYDPTAVAVDAGGVLYVAESLAGGEGRIQKRDTEGNWSVLARPGFDLGQVYNPRALGVDNQGNLYVADEGDGYGRVQKRDAQGNWSVIATHSGTLAVDAAGDLYVAIYPTPDSAVEITKWYANGNRSILGTVDQVQALAVDTERKLYVAGWKPGYVSYRIRDSQGNWSVIPFDERESVPAGYPSALAVDRAGNLYVASIEIPLFGGSQQILRRDPQGNWSVLASIGSDLGHVFNASGLAVDSAGNLYVADNANHRVQKYTPDP